MGEELTYIPDVIGGDCHFTLREDEPIGFIFPVHAWRPPLMVRKFIEQLSLSSLHTPHFTLHKKPYTFALCTAGDSIGRTIEILADDLKRKGLTLDAAFSLIMPESYVGLPFMDVDPKEKERRKKQQAAADLERFATMITQRQTTYREGSSDTDLHRGPIPAFFSGPVGSFFVKHLITDKPFHVETDRCIGCGKCAKVCPVGDIQLSPTTHHPTWLHNGHCLTCFTCYHHCPTHAIEFGRRTKNKGQYLYRDE